MPSEARGARWIALVAALIGALLWIVIASTPPTARGLDTPPADFSAARAMDVVRAIARSPHPLGSPENARVRAELTTRLQALGAQISEQIVPLDEKSVQRLAKWRGAPATGVTGVNIIAVLPGRDRSLPAVAVMAHHDSVWASPGAADDGAGLATAIETLRAIRATGTPPERDVIVLLVDGEEIGLNGSRAFFGSHPLAKHVGVVVNLDSRGAGGRANMFETGRGNGAMMRLYADVVARPAANSVAVLVYDRMPNSTDYTNAKDRGVAGFNIAMLGRAWTYHSPLSTPDALDTGTLQDMGDQTLALTRALAFARTLPAPAPDAAFADVMGRVTIVYPAVWGWAVIAVALALFVFSGSRDRPELRSVGGGVVVTLALLVHTALLLTTVNALSGSGAHNYYDRLASLTRLETQAWLAVAASLAILPLMRRPGVRLVAVLPAQILMWTGLLAGGPLPLLIVLAVIAMLLGVTLPKSADGPRGASLLLLLFTVLIQIFLPTAAPLFAWPLLLAGLAAAARSTFSTKIGLAVTALCAAVALGHVGAMCHFVMLALGAELPLVLVVGMLCGMPLIWPLLPHKPAPRTAGLLLFAAVGIALWVRFDATAASVPPYSLSDGRKTKG